MRLLTYGKLSTTQGVVKLLGQSGMAVDTCNTQEGLFYSSLTHVYEAVIIIGEDSAEALAKLYAAWRAEGCASLFVVLTTNYSVTDRAIAMGLGIDMYYIQPCSYTMLLVEIIRRTSQKQLLDRPTCKTLHFEIDLLSRAAWVDGRPLLLTRVQFDMFSYLIKMRGRVVSRLQILEEVWGHDEFPLGNTVDVHMYRLKQKLGEYSQLITAVQGIGYRMHELA